MERLLDPMELLDSQWIVDFLQENDLIVIDAFNGAVIQPLPYAGQGHAIGRDRPFAECFLKDQLVAGV